MGEQGQPFQFAPGLLAFGLRRVRRLRVEHPSECACARRGRFSSPAKRAPAEHRRRRARGGGGRGARRLSYWLDRAQQAHDLIADLFTRVNASMDRVVLVEERDPRDEGYEPLDWRSALAHVPGEAVCAVWDSLETWAGSYTEQAELARAVSAHGAAVKLILCGTNAAGDVEGLARLRRAGDAVVVLDAEGWLVKKCRWLPPPALPASASRGRRAACPALGLPASSSKNRGARSCASC